MSKSTWWGVGAIVVIAAAAAWYAWGGQGNVNELYPAQSGQQAASSSAALPAGSDSSDAALNADLSAVDSNMANFSGDNSSMNSSMSDQEVSQSSL